MRIDDSSRHQSQLDILQSQAQRSFQLQQEIATGSKVNRPSDQPALYQLKDDLTRRVERLQSDQQFLSEQASRLDHYDSLIGGLTEHLRSARTMVQRASNAASDPQALAGMKQEVNRLIEASLSLVNAEVGGRHLFAGTRVEQAPFQTQQVAGAVQAVNYSGDASFPGIPLPDGQRLQLPLDGRSLTEAPGAELFQTLIDFRSALDGQPVDAEPHLSRLARLEEHLNLRRADTGAASRYLGQIGSHLQSEELQTRQQLSTYTESDLPTSITQLLQNEVSQQASYSTISRVARLSLVDYLR